MNALASEKGRFGETEKAGKCPQDITQHDYRKEGRHRVKVAECRQEKINNRLTDVFAAAICIETSRETLRKDSGKTLWSWPRSRCMEAGWWKAQQKAKNEQL